MSRAHRAAHRATLVAAAVLAAGYLGLAKGGMTMPALLLVIAYCVAIPVAILRFPGRERR